MSPVGPGLTASDSFSIFWVTDTQFLSEDNPALFRMLANWIAANWSQYNGKLVIHSGDIVQNGTSVTEWEAANGAFSILLKNKIPYVWCAGNHDVQDGATPASGWVGSTYAPTLNPTIVSGAVNSMSGVNWVGDYHNGMNNAVSFSVNGLNFLVICIEWIADAGALAWAESILQDHAFNGYHVIVAPHAYINANGSLNDPLWAAQMSQFITEFTPILDSHSSNVFLTLNGHFATDVGYNTPSPVNGRNELMFDRQDSLDCLNEPTGRGADNVSLTAVDSDLVGGATLMVLTFNPISNTVDARTYDVYAGAWRMSSYEQYSFTMFPSPSGGVQTATVIPEPTG